jgi:hypothetical protein
MKIGFSNIVASAVLTAGLVSMSATGALAKPKPPAGGGGDDTSTNILCSDIGDVFSGIATYTGCEGVFSGNDSNSLEQVADLFEEGASINNNWANNDAYKIDIDEEYVENVTTEYYKMFGLGGEDGNTGTIEFVKDIESEFAIVLKTATSWSAYKFDGITAGTSFDWNTLGVSTNKGQGRGLSHLSLYVSDTGVDVENPPVEVPEPTTLLGLIAVGGMLVGKKGLSRKS